MHEIWLTPNLHYTLGCLYQRVLYVSKSTSHESSQNHCDIMQYGLITST